MKKTKESIEIKRDKKIKEIIAKADYELDKKCEEAHKKGVEYESKLINKYIRKRNAYVNKKKVEYDRKCKNEIRKLEGKEERIYKKKEPKFKLREFVMELMQENSKLRDTDRDGNGFCISCNRLCTWSELAGGHRWSRGVKNICTVEENINAQCHKCNFTTGPRGDAVAKERVNSVYDENLDKKYGEGTSRRLRTLKDDYFKNVNGTTYGLIVSNDLIEKAIEENELRWKNKSFYKPKKNWRKIWEAVIA